MRKKLNSENFLFVITLAILFCLFETIGIALIVQFILTDLMIVSVFGSIIAILGFYFLYKIILIVKSKEAIREKNTISTIQQKSKRNIINVDETNAIDPTVSAQTTNIHKY